MKTFIWTGGLVLFLALTSLALVFTPLPGSATRAERQGDTDGKTPGEHRRDTLAGIRGDIDDASSELAKGLVSELAKVESSFCGVDVSSIRSLLERFEADDSTRPDVERELGRSFIYR